MGYNPGHSPQIYTTRAFDSQDRHLGKGSIVCLVMWGEESSQAQSVCYDLFRFPDPEPIPYISLSSAYTCHLIPTRLCHRLASLWG